MVFSYDAETYRGLTRSDQSSPDYPTQWSSFIGEIKALYYKNNYKRCAGECEKMLRDQTGRLHPLHETFLHFFIAICNESLGLAAHKFSSKKLTFLHLAKDAFTAALVSLPLPYATDDSGDYSAFPIMPHSPNIGHIDDYQCQEVSVSQWPELDVFPSSGPISDVKSSLHGRRDSGYDSESDSSPVFGDKAPECNNYPTRQPLRSLNPNTISTITTPHHAEEPQELNLNEANLIPKPLSITKRASDPTIITPRPLPPLPPLGHRKTALHPAPHNPLTPQSPPLTSPALTLYNTHLSTFRTLLSKHLSTITTTITSTTTLQAEHKLNQNQRLASFWTFKPVVVAADAEDGTAEGQREKEKRERIERLRRDGWRVRKERYGWKGEAFYARLRGEALGEVEMRG